MTTQITPLDLEANLTGVKTKRSYVSIGGQRGDYTRRFVYFDPFAADFQIPTDSGGTYVIPLRMEKYGFPDARTVRVDKGGRVTGVSPEVESLYRGLFEREEVPLNEALEILGKTVNDSMEYDIDALNGRDDISSASQELIERVKASGYIPTGQETVKGICKDAGPLIRALLGYTLRDSSLKYIGIDSINETGDSHDITLLLDPETENWVIVNSKSPLKPYNIVPREKLQELGSPFNQKSETIHKEQY